MMKPKMQRNGIQNTYPPLKDTCLYMQRFLFELPKRGKQVTHPRARVPQEPQHDNTDNATKTSSYPLGLEFQMSILKSPSIYDA